jgi:hypothetical protein
VAKSRSTVVVKIDPKKVVKLTEDQLTRNMEVATVVLRDAVKLKLNRGQPTRTTPGGYIVGLSPSKPGEPPKKVTGQYQNSITNQVIKQKGEIIGVVGTNQKRGPALEFGNRTGTLKARPHFRPTLRENSRKLLNIIAKGIGAV